MQKISTMLCTGLVGWWGTVKPVFTVQHLALGCSARNGAEMPVRLGCRDVMGICTACGRHHHHYRAGRIFAANAAIPLREQPFHV
jgi:hypothetical protein